MMDMAKQGKTSDRSGLLTESVTAGEDAGALSRSRSYGRRQATAQWLDEHTARLAAGLWVRWGLLRMAMRRRDRIPELAVLALEQVAQR